MASLLRAACRTTTSASCFTQNCCAAGPGPADRRRRRHTARTDLALTWASSSTSTSEKSDEEYVQVLAAAPEPSDVYCRPSPKTTRCRRDCPPHHLADANAQRGRQPCIRHPSGSQPGARQRSHCGNSNLSLSESALAVTILNLGEFPLVCSHERESKGEGSISVPADSRSC